MIAITMIPGATTIMASVTLAAAHRRNDDATGSDQHQQERAPGLREDTSPLKGGIEEIACQLPLDHTLLLRHVRLAAAQSIPCPPPIQSSARVAFPNHSLDRKRSTLPVLDNLHRHVAQLSKDSAPTAQGPPIVKIDLHRSPHSNPSGNREALSHDGSPSVRVAAQQHLAEKQTGRQEQKPDEKTGAALLQQALELQVGNLARWAKWLWTAVLISSLGSSAGHWSK